MSDDSSEGNDVVATPKNVSLLLNVESNEMGDSVLVEPLSQECSKNCVYQIAENSSIELTAVASSTQKFESWKGNCAAVEKNVCSLKMANDESISAIFSSDVLTQLTLNFVGNGQGKVIINNGEFECSDTCDMLLPKNNKVYLNATSDEFNYFQGWPECQQNNPCEFDLVEGKTINVNFNAVERVNLTIDIDGQGIVEVNTPHQTCIDFCNLSIQKGQELELTAKPDENSIFVKWSNHCGQSPLCNITMTEPSNVTALFAPKALDRNQNALFISEPLGIPRDNYPLQFGRPFIKGEIPNLPSITINGVKPLQQVNVKQRYEDGSVKHAIFNVIIERIEASKTLSLIFSNTEEITVNTPLTKEEMLSSNFNFDAKMTFTFDEAISISAQDMLTNGNFDYWLKGQVATSILIQDHSINRLYDIGSDEHRSIRPLFFVTFWPTINHYTVRYVTENINTETLQDQTYDIDLLIGDAESPIYRHEKLFHPGKTRWSKLFTQNEEMKPLSIDHNIDYLVKTESIPDFDIDRKIPKEQIIQDWNKWEEKNKDLFEAGLWQIRMGTAGGRQDIGLYPSWTVKWLYTGDWRHQEVALKQAELSAAWPMHLREGKAGLTFDYNGIVDGLGKTISMAPGARPQHWVERPDWHEIKGVSRIEPKQVLAINPWVPDQAHHPDISSPQFLLTGDYFFLEQMLFSSSFTGSNNNASGTKYRFGRGPTGSEGALYARESRGQAWGLRTRVHTFDIIPDDMPEKNYHKYLTESAIAQFQGLFHLDNTYPQFQSSYEHAKEIIRISAFPKTGKPSPLGSWDEGKISASYVNDKFFDTSKVNKAVAPWMQNFVIVALGRARELGFDTNTLLLYAGQQLTGPFEAESVPLEMFSSYVLPTLDNNDEWLLSWSEIYSLYNPKYVIQIKDKLSNGTDSEHGYYSIGMAAASYLDESENFEVLWEYMTKNVASKSIYENNPQWAIVPRQSIKVASKSH